MTLLHYESTVQLTKAAEKSVSEMKARERVWNEEQRHLLTVKDEQNLNKKLKERDYQARTLQHCKRWGGPCVTVEDLERALGAAETADGN